MLVRLVVGLGIIVLTLGIALRRIVFLARLITSGQRSPGRLTDLPDRIKSEIKLIDGERTLEQIAEETSLSEFELCKLIYELKSRGIESVVEREVARASAIAAEGVPRARVAYEATKRAGPEGERLAAALFEPLP